MISGEVTVDRELRILLDERAITAVMNEYCHAMDSGQHDRWMNCFTTDAVYDVALPNGRIYARLEGETEFRHFIANYPVLAGHKHVYVTPIFEVDPDAGTATVAAYWFMLSGGENTAGRRHGVEQRTIILAVERNTKVLGRVVRDSTG